MPVLVRNSNIGRNLFLVFTCTSCAAEVLGADLEHWRLQSGRDWRFVEEVGFEDKFVLIIPLRDYHATET
jgi:hypothetical protein